MDWTGFVGQRHNIYGSICRLFVASLYFLLVRSRLSSYPVSSQVFNACGRIFTDIISLMAFQFHGFVWVASFDFLFV